MKLWGRKSVFARGSSDKGFTLIASALGVIIFSALCASFAADLGKVRATREQIRATQIMLKCLERVRLSTFPQVTDTTINPQSYTEYYDPRDQAAGRGGLAYHVTLTASVPPVRSIPETYRTNLLLITVTTAWASGSAQHTRSMQTLVAREGLQTYLSTGGHRPIMRD
jgi:type II secretory pathway pseudopilin PulG